MTFLEILNTIFIEPLQLLFELIYTQTVKMIQNPGLSLIVLSLAINFLVLPLYKRADEIQEEEKNIEAKLKAGIDHIKKTFKGDERMMMLQTYYRQNNYKPTDVFKNSISLLLQIPFFMAAYQFLSNTELLNGASLWVIKDLSQQDGLLCIGEWHINLLPILMTAINLISCIIYTKGAPLKSKIQLYAMALFFLFFLYDSPSGLVFYWTLNNVFSLCKTIFYKFKNPKRALYILFAGMGVGLIIFAQTWSELSLLRRIILTVLGVVLFLPLIWSILKTRIHFKPLQLKWESNSKVFLLGSLILAIVVGGLIPSGVIASSPQEFVSITNFLHPIWYIVSALCLSIGLFVVWIGVFYWLANKKTRVIFELGVWVLCGSFLVDYMIFGKNDSILSNTLQFEKGLTVIPWQGLLNIGVLILLACAFIAIAYFFKKILKPALLIGLLSLTVLSCVNVVKINTEVEKIDLTQASTENLPEFSFSKEGDNVVVIMLDRAMGEYVPYLFAENSELLKSFEGFTYYKNVISFGSFTNTGSPSLYGGYEYTPVEMNKRDTELLADKHDEALLVMPVLFEQNGYDVVVCDPTYAGYQWVPDLSIYDEYPNIKSYITEGMFSSESIVEMQNNNKITFFCYGLMKAAPLYAQPLLYGKGTYNLNYTAQTISEDLMTAHGYKEGFVKSYSVLTKLTDFTQFVNDDSNHFLIMTNNTCHEPQLLQEPNYEPANSVDNTEYEATRQDVVVDGVALKQETVEQKIHYQTMMATFIQLAKWFDYLKANDVYDNTRIILVSDHGRNVNQLPDSTVDNSTDTYYNTEWYFPLLMVKDFNATEFSVSNEFMTNADTPVLAFADLLDNPVNPFTGKDITSNEKTAHPQLVFTSNKYDVNVNNGTQYLAGNWLSVSTDRNNINNWEVVAENEILH